METLSEATLSLFRLHVERKGRIPVDDATREPYRELARAGLGDTRSFVHRRRREHRPADESRVRFEECYLPIARRIRLASPPIGGTASAACFGPENPRGKNLLNNGLCLTIDDGSGNHKPTRHISSPIGRGGRPMIVRKHASFSAFTCVVAVLVLALAR